MTPTKLRECLATLHWSQRGFARIIGYDEGTVRQWARGSVSVPDQIAAWLNLRANFAFKNPPPLRFREPKLSRENDNG